MAKHFHGQNISQDLIENPIYSEGTYVPSINIIPLKIWIIQNHPYINYIKVFYIETNQNFIEWNICGWRSSSDYEKQPFWTSKFTTDQLFL